MGRAERLVIDQRQNASDPLLSSKPISLIAWGEVGRAAPKCGVTVPVHSQTGKEDRCPMECPLFADHRDDGIHCDFRCVEATVEACQAMNPQEPIPDLERGICRACLVYGCRDCATDGTERCAACSAGYELKDGECHSYYFYTWVLCFLAATATGAVVLAWFIDLARRPETNRETLEHALVERSRKKLHMPKDGDHPRALWPLSTNLTTQDVGGPGLRLFFNFQVFVIIWALIFAVTWCILAHNTDEEFLTLGMNTAENARQNCIIVAHGYETQRRLMPTKCHYMVYMYFFSFAISIAFSVRQKRMFQVIDNDQTTYKDFCARLYDMPELDGKDQCEEEIKKVVEEATGQKVIGVSVCWDFAEHSDEVMEALSNDMDARLEVLRAQTPMACRSTICQGSPQEDAQKEQCWIFELVEDKIFGSATKDILSSARHKPEGAYASTDSDCAQAMKDLLAEMKSTKQAFVVFETESARNDAVKKVAESGITIRGVTAKLEETDKEPASVQWVNCVEQTLTWKVKRIIGGFFTIFVALATWVLAFYAPYAYFLMSFNYAYGQEPGLVANLAFTMVVVIGNVAMYFVCSEVADRIGFQYNDDREVCYMLLYSFACICNVLLDMVVTYNMAYWMMVGVNMHTYHGRPLSEVQGFVTRFETYAMQRSLGQNLMAYAFPSTYLVPFVLEPLGTIYLPYKLMSFIVRTHRNVSRTDAEKLLAATPMDLSRYADVMLNVLLAALVFYFPGGFTQRIFFALAGSHIVIYVADHYKVLRCIPACYFASDAVDWWAQWMFGMPTAIILSALVFKINCLLTNRLRGVAVIVLIIAAFLFHMVLHTFAMRRLVPLFVAEAKPRSETYQDCALKHAASWFSMNPVHCLRSQLIYKHNPPCDYLFPGKEHMLRVNPEIGCLFKDDETAAEDFTEHMWQVRSVRELTNLIWAGTPPAASRGPLLPEVPESQPTSPMGAALPASPTAAAKPPPSPTAMAKPPSSPSAAAQPPSPTAAAETTKKSD